MDYQPYLNPKITHEIFFAPETSVRNDNLERKGFGWIGNLSLLRLEITETVSLQLTTRFSIPQNVVVLENSQ